ncbi:MAG: transcription termination/antitermination protein NusG [Planctomycetaceae bacterium]|nr:transcription termination/antitermination protein NusG [Planctomycetaceae bacterium]
MVDLHDENHEEQYGVTAGDVPPVADTEVTVAKTEPEASIGKWEGEKSVFEVPSSELDGKMDWYILKVQVNREDVIKESLRRKVHVAGMEQYFDQILVPSEKVTEVRGGKKKVVRKKLYPGYIMIRMVVNDDTWFLVRETAGIGDFTGAAGRPTPMLAHEVERILASESEDKADSPKLRIPYVVGSKVKIKDGTFINFEGEVNGIDTTSGRVTVMLSIFGRSTPVELEYWQVELLQ